MALHVTQKDLMKSREHKKINKTLDNLYTCYILITCKPPTNDGKMSVEMSYKGDALISSYLLEQAQSIIDSEIQIPSEDSSEKIIAISS